jgi:hypothetical protein
MLYPSLRVVDIDGPFAGLSHRDYAQALSHICRFHGCVPWHYSVAQHSLMVAAVAAEIELAIAALGPGDNVSPDAAPLAFLGGLVHDAHEMLTNDMSRPAKRLPDLSGYRSFENRTEAKVLRQFGLAPATMPQSVKFADTLLCEVENLWRRDPYGAHAAVGRFRGRNVHAGVTSMRRLDPAHVAAEWYATLQTAMSIVSLSPLNRCHVDWLTFRRNVAGLTNLTVSVAPSDNRQENCDAESPPASRGPLPPEGWTTPPYDPAWFDTPGGAPEAKAEDSHSADARRHDVP